ncbi:MAG TPA: histidine kinase, partial [Bacteroidia bacterium]|nr:histidine kinase [Bacteroidia bacterium]
NPLKETKGSIRTINPKVAIKCFASNKKGSLWGGNYVYLEKIDPLSGLSLMFTKTKSRILSLYCDEHEVIWLGCINGLWKYKGNTFYYMGDSLPLFKNRIEDIKVAPDGTWWFATKGAGIVTKKGMRINHLTQKTGLAGNSCTSLFIDAGGIVWAGTSKGINKITQNGPGQFTYERYSAGEGLQSDEINQVVKSGNYVWAATNQGILFFNANTHITNSVPPSVYLTDITVGSEKQKAGTYLNLKYFQNHIQLSFVGLSYKGNTKIRYKYILEGLDTAWNYTQNTSIQYTTLPPGDYSFTVYALNCSGVQSEQPATLHFIINRPFWLEKWFIVLLTVLSLGIIFLLYSLRIRSIERRISEKEEISRKMTEMELKALRAQMNPHFIFNCITSIQHFILKNDTESADNYLSSFAQLIRSVLTYSRFEFIPLETEMEMLELYLHLESMRFSSKFSFKVRAHENLDIENLCLPPMVIQPYVENAIWHGLMHLIDKKAELSILFEQVDGHLKCIVEDNGIGRMRSKQQKVTSKHKSLGLSITSERFEYMNSLYQSNLSINIIDKTDEQGSASGTRVELLIPIKTNIHPKPPM